MESQRSHKIKHSVNSLLIKKTFFFSTAISRRFLLVDNRAVAAKVVKEQRLMCKVLDAAVPPELQTGIDLFCLGLSCAMDPLRLALLCHQ